jgi:hypothetical protein
MADYSVDMLGVIKYGGLWCQYVGCHKI